MKPISMDGMTVVEQPLHVLLYGVPGAGKTHLLRELPKPMLVMSFDHKYEPLMGVAGIDLVTYRMNEAKDAKDIIPTFFRDFQDAKKDQKYKTIAVDNITSMNPILERWAVINTGKKQAEDKATLQEYGDIKRWYETFFASTVGTTKNIIVLAHEDINTDDEGGLINIRPSITGKIANTLSGYFKNTWQLELKPGNTGECKRVLHYMPYKKYICSTTTMGGSGVIEEPTWDKIKALIKK